MRQITRDAASAFVSGVAFNRDNTRVIVKGSLVQFELHGSLIAERSSSTLALSSCGYHTNTTKERLNGIMQAYNVGGIYQRAGKWFNADGSDWIDGTKYNIGGAL